LLWIGAKRRDERLETDRNCVGRHQPLRTVSPDRKTIIVDLQETLWALPAAGGTAKRLTDPLLDRHSPTGRPKAMRSLSNPTKAERSHLAHEADGTGVRQLTDGHSDDRDPRFSPTERAWRSHRTGD